MEIKELLETRKAEFAELEIEIKANIESLNKDIEIKNKEIQAKNNAILGKRVQLTALEKSIQDLESLS